MVSIGCEYPVIMLPISYLYFTPCQHTLFCVLNIDVCLYTLLCYLDNKRHRILWWGVLWVSIDERGCWYELENELSWVPSPSGTWWCFPNQWPYQILCSIYWGKMCLQGLGGEKWDLLYLGWLEWWFGFQYSNLSNTCNRIICCQYSGGNIFLQDGVLCRPKPHG